jgi:heat shock protein HslJ
VLLFAVALFGFTAVFANNELVDTSWELVTFNGTGAMGTLEFDETTMYSKFCNNVSQGYVYASGAISATGNAISTLMFCEGIAGEMETAFQIATGAGTPVIRSGDMLTITTAEDDVFVFTMEDDAVMCTMEYDPVCGVDGMTYGNACTAGAASVAIAYEGECVEGHPTDDATCVSMFDGCNTCMRMEGEDTWACTKMFCETPTAAYCIEHSDEADAHGCVDGNTWSQSQKACVDAENDTGASSLEVAYDFAFNVGMTTMETLPTFRSNDVITRQEAAKMFVALAVGAYDKDAEASSELCVTYSDDAIFDYSLRSFIYSACAHGMMK